MTWLFENYLACSLIMALLTLLLYVLSPLLGKRYKATSLYAAWAVLLLGFLIPLQLANTQPVVTAQMPPAMAAPVFTNTAVPAEYARTAPALPRATDVMPQAAAQAASQPAAAPAMTWLQLTTYLWFGGAVGTLLIHSLRHLLFMRTLRRWWQPATSPQLIAALDAQKQLLGIRRHVTLMLCPAAGSPMMTGLFRPKLLLPDDDLTADELPLVLRHELIHFHRGDLWVKAGLVLAKALHWFNPAAYLLSRQVSFWQESACDERVTAHDSFEAKQFYSETIIRVIRNQAHAKSALTTSFYGGKNGLKRRILTVLQSGRKRVGIALCAGTLIISASLGMAFAVDVAPSPVPAPPAQGTLAYVANADTQGSVMLTVPSVNDISYPIAAYFVGTPVTVVETCTSSALPEWESDLWDYVLVGGDGTASGISGWMPQVYLSDTPAAALPEATLTTDALTGHINLYTLNDVASTVINSYPSGTKVTLLGRVQKWYQVELNGVYGFVQRDYLTMDDAVQARYDTFKPSRFDGITRERYQKMLNFERLYAQKSEEYGGLDLEQWSVEDKAWYGQLEENYTGTHDYYYQLPQEGDLQQTDAVRIAWETFIADCKLPDAKQADYDFNLGFYAFPSLDGYVKQWDIELNLKDGHTRFAITLASPSGEVLKKDQAQDYLLSIQEEAEAVAASAAYSLALEAWTKERGAAFDFWPLKDKVAFNTQYSDGSLRMPEYGALPQERAEALAREHFVSAYQVSQAETEAWVATSEYRKTEDYTGRWYVTFFGSKAESDYIVYAALDAFTGEVMESGDPAELGNG